MGGLRVPHSDRAAGSSSRGGPGSSDIHPLLALQELAGNQAVTAFVQRKAHAYHSSKVALATMQSIYDGKCDASTHGAEVKRRFSRGVTGKDVAIAFKCGT